jgi:hypothetical protein
VAGDSPSGTAASGDAYLMLDARAVAEGERRLASGMVMTPREGEVVDVGKALSAANENVGCLHDGVETRTTAVVVEFDDSLFVPGDNLPRALRWHSPEVEAVGQADEVGGEAITAHVGAFPRFLRAMSN